MYLPRTYPIPHCIITKSCTRWISLNPGGNYTASLPELPSMATTTVSENYSKPEPMLARMTTKRYSGPPAGIS